MVGKNVMLYIHPKGNNKIKYNGGAEGEKGNVYKIFADGTCWDTNFFANPGTNTEGIPLNIFFKPVHRTNVKRLRL